MESTTSLYLETAENISRINSTPMVYELYRLLLHRLVTGYGPEHYVTYSLFNKPINFKSWREYLDKRDLCKLLFNYNKKTRIAILEDKVAFAGICREHNLPHPEVKFTLNYDGKASALPNHDQESVDDAFSNLADGDYIIKTCSGSYGINLWSVTKSGRTILLHNDKTLLDQNRFSQQLVKSGESYLVQNKIEVAQSLRPIMPGIACGSIRVHSFLRGDGTVLIPYVMPKLTTVGPVSDNFAGGKSGNMLGIVDMDRQCISRVVRKLPNGLLREVSHHPDTDVDLRDYPFPELEQAVELARRCALACADVPAVGWDIVVTQKGAVVLEGNPMFDPAGPQLCADRGVRHIIPRLLG